MPRLLSTYIFKEILTPFLLCAAILTITVLLSKILKLVDLVLTFGVDISLVFSFIISIIPAFQVFVLPIAFIVAVLVACARLSSDNEIIAMKSSGIGLFTILKPVLVFALFAYMITTAVTLYLYPWGNRNLKETLFNVTRTNTLSGLTEKTFFSRFDGVVLYVDQISKEGNNVNGVFIQRLKRNPETRKLDSTLIFAKSGSFVSSPDDLDVSLRLTQGSIHRSTKNPTDPDKEDDYHYIGFKNYSVSLNLHDTLQSLKGERRLKELYAGELFQKIKRLKSEGKNPLAERLELQKRFALPATVFVFALLGVPLGIQRVRSARLTGFTVALIIILVYYVLFQILEAFCASAELGPIISAWSANVIMGIVGLYVYYRAAKDKKIGLVEFVSGISNYIRAPFRSTRTDSRDGKEQRTDEDNK